MKSVSVSLLLLLLGNHVSNAELHPSLDLVEENTRGGGEGKAVDVIDRENEVRSLQQSCPVGELWESYSGTCVANDCSSPQACPLPGETCRNVRRICDPRWPDTRVW